MAKQGNPVLAKWMGASGVFSLLIAVVIGVLIGPIYGLAVGAFSLIDFGLAFLYGRGMIGTNFNAVATNPVDEKEPDLSENPYARED